MGLDISRIGNISTLDLGKGTAKVHYADTGNTTSDMPLFRFGDEFNPPNVGDQVIVIHLSNDSSSGVILGKFWDETEPPKIKQGYRKGFGEGAYETAQTGVYTLHADEIILEGKSGSMTLSQIIELEKRVTDLEGRG